MATVNQTDIIILQRRDQFLLRDLFESRVMTSAHVAALHFEGSKEAAKKRLQKLKAAGYVNERTRRSTEPAVIFLTSKAFSHLRTEGVLAQYPALGARSLEKRARVSDLTLRHELEVMDVKAGFHQAARKTQNITVAEFTTWPALHQFEVSHDGFRETLVKPDGFIRISGASASSGTPRAAANPIPWLCFRRRSAVTSLAISRLSS